MTIFFHVDIDAFFASVEQLDNPAYAGLPVIVGGQGLRGVVSTCSYEARKFGVHSAMPTAQARRLCPQGIFITGRMSRYKEISAKVMRIFKNFSPTVQQLSIDEAFLDLSGTERLYGTPHASAMQLKQDIKTQTGLSISIGIAPTKYLAKIASAKSKPDGLYLVESGTEALFMQTLDLPEVWGVGVATRKKLASYGYLTIKQILTLSQNELQTMIGNANGQFLFNILRGQTNQVFNRPVKKHSTSSEQTFEKDINDEQTLYTLLFKMSSEIMAQMIAHNIEAKTVFIKIRYANFETHSMQETANYINDTEDLFQRAKALFQKKYNFKDGIRLLGVGIEHCIKESASAQLNLIEDEQTLIEEAQKIKRRKIEEQAFLLEKKCGKAQLMRARLLQPESSK